MPYGIESMVYSAGNDITDSFIKEVEHAVISVIDCRNMSETSDIKTSAAGQLGKNIEITKMAGNTVKKEPEMKHFTVQFNPSQLSYSVQESPKEEKTNFAVGQKMDHYLQQYQPENRKSKITLRVKLIFDSIDNMNAFYEDRIKFAPIYGAKKLLKIKSQSVQPIVEGFIAAVLNPATRNVIFTWNELVFKGMLSDVAAEYTMFDTDGNPVRANLDLTITGEEGADNNGEFVKDYKRLLQMPSDFAVKKEQALSGIINLSI